jgi:hypothetical protein
MSVLKIRVENARGRMRPLLFTNTYIVVIRGSSDIETSGGCAQPLRIYTNPEAKDFRGGVWSK